MMFKVQNEAAGSPSSDPCLAAFLEFDLPTTRLPCRPCYNYFSSISSIILLLYSHFFLLFNSSSIPRVFILQSRYITVPCLH